MNPKESVPHQATFRPGSGSYRGRASMWVPAGGSLRPLTSSDRGDGRRRRAAAVVIVDSHVLVIERRWHRRFNGEPYFLFPGGGLEPGETPEDALRREVLEEIGAEVIDPRLLATVSMRSAFQYYFLANLVEGMRTYNWEEPHDPDNHYAPRWIPSSEMSSHRILPASLASLVSRCCADGTWPEEVVELEEESV